MPQYTQAATFYTLTDTERMPGYVGLDGQAVKPGPMTYFDMGFLTPDLNADGLPDLVIALSRGVQLTQTARSGARFFLNDGRGGLTDITATVSGGTLPMRELSGYASGNLDADSSDELLLVGSGPRDNPTGEPIAYYDASATGVVNRSQELPDLSPTNASATGVSNGPRSITGYDVSMGDLDGDGDSDALVLTHGGPANMQPAFTLVNDGAGLFTVRSSEALTAFSRQHFGTAGPYNDWFRSALLDANGDGALDVVVSVISREPNGRSSFVALNDGQGGFSTSRTVELPAPLFGKGNSDNRDVATGDLNGDGLADIVFSQTRIQPFLAGRGVQLLLNDGKGGFTDQSGRITFTNPRPDGTQTYTDPKQIALFDFNHDGALDIIERGQNVRGDPAPLNFSVFLNDGRGYFTEMPRAEFAGLTYRQDGIPAGVEPMWGDFNADGITDFILTSARDDGTTLSLSMTLFQGITPNLQAPARTFTNLAAAQTFTGGPGIDTAVYAGERATYRLTTVNGDRKLSAQQGTEGTDTLRSIERLQFADARLALDVGATQSAGQAVLLLGAVLPGTLVLDASKQALLGSVMGLFDQGYTLPVLAGAVMRLPIWDVLTGQAMPTPADVARYLLTNVNGTTPDAGLLATATATLGAQAQTAAEGQWLAELAASATNQARIDLVGLAAGGLVYA